MYGGKVLDMMLPENSLIRMEMNGFRTRLTKHKSQLLIQTHGSPQKLPIVHASVLNGKIQMEFQFQQSSLEEEDHQQSHWFTNQLTVHMVFLWVQLLDHKLLQLHLI
jgi:hypothetical protein